MWVMEADVVKSINTKHENSFLPGFQLHDNLTATSDVGDAVSNAEVGCTPPAYHKKLLLSSETLKFLILFGTFQCCSVLFGIVQYCSVQYPEDPKAAN